MDAFLYAQGALSAQAEDTIQFTALFAPEDVPDAASFDVNVNGEPLTVDVCGGDYRGCILRGAGARIGPGERYTFTLDLPWADAAEISSAMVERPEFLTPAPGAEVSTGAVTTLRWSSAETGTFDAVVVLVAADSGAVDAGARLEVPPGEHSVDVTPADLAEALDNVERFLNLTPPFGAELVLVRSRRTSSAPPFRAGDVVIEDVVARLPVIIAP